MHERNHRRRGWTRGVETCLADGSCWHLPRIDFALMATTSDLQARMTEVFYLARETQYETGGTTTQFKTALYHVRMSILAVTLLRTNYELTELEWKQLTDFGSLQEMVDFSERTSTIFFDTSDVWMPFLTTYGPANREALLLN